MGFLKMIRVFMASFAHRSFWFKNQWCLFSLKDVLKVVKNSEISTKHLHKDTLRCKYVNIPLKINRSLSLVNEESYLFVVEIDEPVFFMNNMRPKAIAHKNMPVGVELDIQKLFQTLTDLNIKPSTLSPSFSTASLWTFSWFFTYWIAASRISSEQSKGQSTSAPKRVL